MTSKSVLLGAAVLLVAGAGLASVVLKSGGDDVEPEPVVIAQANEVMKTIPQEPTQAQREFQSMAVPTDKGSCSVPFVPSDLHQDLLVRSSYASIMRIIAAERWEETGSCECFYADISWDDVVEAAPQFSEPEVSGSSLNPTKLRRMANELEIRRAMVCDS